MKKINDFIVEQQAISPDVVEEVKAALPDLEAEIHKLTKTDMHMELDVQVVRNRIQIFSKNLVDYFDPMGKFLFKEIVFLTWGGEHSKGNTVWFKPKVDFTYVNGGSNGTDILWDSIWFDCKKKKWVFGRVIK